MGIVYARHMWDSGSSTQQRKGKGGARRMKGGEAEDGKTEENEERGRKASPSSLLHASSTTAKPFLSHLNESRRN